MRRREKSRTTVVALATSISARRSSLKTARSGVSLNDSHSGRSDPSVADISAIASQPRLELLRGAWQACIN